MPSEQLRAPQRETTRSAIIDAALSLVDAHGIEAATLDAIAARLGLTKQGLYYHFRSKEALLAEAALHDWTQAAESVCSATSAARSAEDAVEALVRTYVGYYAGRLQRFRLATQSSTLSAESAAQARARLSAVRPLNDLMYSPTEHWLRKAQAEGNADPELDPRRLAFLAHTSAMGLLTMKLLVSGVQDPLVHSDEDLLAELCRNLRAGLRRIKPRRASR